MKTEFSLGIRKIKDIEFFIDESVELSDSQNLGIGFELLTNIIPTENIIELTLLVIFKSDMNEKIVMRIKTINSFYVEDLAGFKQEGNDMFDLPDLLLVTILSLAVTHTRALLAKNATGTRFADIYIPIINPTDLATELFGLKSINFKGK